jgi:hypothetical protein
MRSSEAIAVAMARLLFDTWTGQAEVPGNDRRSADG